MMAALKCLTNNSKIWFIFMLISIDGHFSIKVFFSWFLEWWVIFNYILCILVIIIICLILLVLIVLTSYSDILSVRSSVCEQIRSPLQMGVGEGMVLLSRPFWWCCHRKIGPWTSPFQVFFIRKGRLFFFFFLDFLFFFSFFLFFSSFLPLFFIFIFLEFYDFPWL